MSIKEKYLKALIKYCKEIKLDYFPQVEASELLFKIIALEDIYLPLSLIKETIDNSHDNNTTVNNVIQRIDEKISQMDAQAEKNRMELDHFDVGAELELLEKYLDENITEIDNRSKHITGVRMLLKAAPGSGKTTFCKRVVLNYKSTDETFYSKFITETHFVLNPDALPILINCKNINELTIEELKTISFQEIIYKLCCFDYGKEIKDISKEQFCRLLNNYTERGLSLIVDGWDEILNNDKKEAFRVIIDEHLADYPNDDFILTIRSGYEAPIFELNYAGCFLIRPLSNDDIIEFCKRWYRVVLNKHSENDDSYLLLARQILNSTDEQINRMRQNPLDLSLLLTIAKNTGVLPSNKADLFQSLIDLDIFWYTNKTVAAMSSKSIFILLAYIASVFSKNDILLCDEDFLIKTVKQAIRDLEGVFIEELSNYDPHILVSELVHTGLLTKTYNGNRYSFSESHKGAHRQMQEYLTAYAIAAQYSDDEYNNMNPSKILADKYQKKSWQEVIVFLVLMNTGRLRNSIVLDLINLIETGEDKDLYENLLFSFIVQDADIRNTERHKIYDIVCRNELSTDLVNNIVSLVSGQNRYSDDFCAYILDLFYSSVENGNYEYSHTYAIIESMKAIQKGLSPFEHAKELIKTNIQKTVVGGLVILKFMAWIKYMGANNIFKEYCFRYKFDPELISLLKKNSIENELDSILIDCIYEAVVAGFVDCCDIYNLPDVLVSFASSNNQQSITLNERLLSVMPIFIRRSYSESICINNAIKDRYIARLNKEIECCNGYCVFLYGICASIGCFSNKELIECWKRIVDYCLQSDWKMMPIDKCRYNQLAQEFNTRVLLDIEEEQLLHGSWIKEKCEDSFAVYSFEIDSKIKMLIDFPDNSLSDDANAFLTDYIVDTIDNRIYLAYLLRRHELKRVTISPDRNKVSIKGLLERGIREGVEMAAINYALYISDIYANHIGKYHRGLAFLKAYKSVFGTDNAKWERVQNKWIKLALDDREYEGIVVLTWLYFIGEFSFEREKEESLRAIIELASEQNRVLQSYSDDAKILIQRIDFLNFASRVLIELTKNHAIEINNI